MALFNFNVPLIQLPVPSGGESVVQLRHESSVTSPMNGNSSSVPQDSRLARNRHTARLRRERKKKEAENLTLLRSQAVLERNRLLMKIEELSQAEKAEFAKLKAQKESGKTISGCLFCEKTFEISAGLSDKDVVNSQIWRHYVNEHPHDTKSSQSHLGGDFLNMTNSPQKLLEHVIKLSEENIGKSHQHSRDSSLESPRNMSLEERRRRRLERNAESARMCRQRKKLYIQRIRLELPSLKREISLMKEFLSNVHKDELVEVPDCSSEASISSQESSNDIKMTGWVNFQKRQKRQLNDDRSSIYSQSSKKSRPDLTQINQNPGYQALLELNNTINNLVLASTLQNLTSLQASNLNARSCQLKNEEDFEAAFTLASLARKV